MTTVRMYCYTYQCSSYESCGSSSGTSCSPMFNTSGNYYYASCGAEFSGANCPLGWGTYSDYLAYRSGCYNGKHYPAAVAPYDGLSRCIGSLHYHHNS